jgi:lipid-binding SYLF domain-containing protein
VEQSSLKTARLSSITAIVLAVCIALSPDPRCAFLSAQSSQPPPANPQPGSPGGGPTAIVDRSYEVLRDTIGRLDGGIPRDLFNKAECIIVIPSVKRTAFIVSASYGQGIMTCRSGEDFRGPWSAPAFVALGGGSFGLQAGGTATDYVIFAMNERVARSVISGKVRLGADTSVVAGPIGRNASAEADMMMNAEMLSWSRTRGTLAGESMQGATINSDDVANKKFYGREVSAKQIIVDGAVRTPPDAKKLTGLLDTVSPKRY